MLRRTLFSLAATIFLVGYASAAPSQSQLPKVQNFLDARNICDEDKPRHLPFRFKKGMITTFIVTAPVDSNGEPPPVPKSAARSLNVVTNLGAFLTISSPRSLNSMEELNREVDRVCDIHRTSGYKMSQARFTTIAELARTQAKREREDRRSSLRWKKWDDQARKAVPDHSELAEFLRDNWDFDKQYLFFGSETKFGRLRDSECKRQHLQFVCKLGVLGTDTQNQTPEYMQLEVTFDRVSRDGRFRLRWIAPVMPDIVVT